MHYKTILLSVEDHVATLTMNRPESLNAINLEMLDELLRAIFACTTNRDVRVVVLRGQGRAFSSGGDIKVMERILCEDAYTFVRDWINRAHLLEMQLRTIAKPVIASIQGARQRPGPESGAGV